LQKLVILAAAEVIEVNVDNPRMIGFTKPEAEILRNVPNELLA
jgi:hypothetical protein